ncbi:MAG: caspase family protein, partial [Muribaculaceae bacterium]|nr:caspase family protein [Muribaculaceae bacterium]
VYVLNAHSKLEPVTRAVTAGTRTSGKAMLAAYGAKLTSSLIIDGRSAELTLPMGANYFYINTPKQIPIKSWKIVPLKNGKNNTRNLPFAKTGVYTGTRSDLEEVELRIEKISDEIYRIVPAETLIKGEYALFRMEAGVPAEVYDFRVDASLSPALDIPKDNAVLAVFNTSQKSPTTSEETSSDILIGSKALLSDVDMDIPTTNKIAENTFALIISNENYKQVEAVPFAHNDCKVFEQYLKLAVGVPENHITRLQDASLSDIKFALNKIKEITEAYEGDAKIIVHYSGHGIPNESNSEGYLLPADGYSSDPSTALKLSDLYATLGKLNAKSLILFLDACFSGAQRSGEMLASARGVSIKVKEDKPAGNLIVISAAQGDQTAYPYKSKEHGLMTYFLLKKLQETSGNVKLGELSDYITTQVKRTSLVENGKSQIPTTIVDDNNVNWRNQTLR